MFACAQQWHVADLLRCFSYKMQLHKHRRSKLIREKNVLSVHLHREMNGRKKLEEDLARLTGAYDAQAALLEAMAEGKK